MVVFVLATLVALAVGLGVGSPAAAAPSSVVLTASPSPSRLNQAVTFTATVTSGGVAVTAGTVTFQRGATILAANVAVDAQGRASFTTSTLVYAVHVITATYNGATGFDPSTSAPLRHLVDPFAPVARPQLAPEPNAAGWNNRNVAVDWRWLEHHSGLDPANCPALSFSAGQGELTLTATCADLVGNQATASQTVKVDLTAPTVTITSPTPGGLAQGATVIADYACADLVSGVVSCSGPVDDGARIDTSTPGEHSFTVTGCDVAGNQQAASVVYQVNGVVGGGVNVAPVLTQPTCQPLGYGEGAPPTVIAPGFTAADVDGTTLAGATVDLGAGYVAGQDVLSLGTNPQNGITAGAFDAGHRHVDADRDRHGGQLPGGAARRPVRQHQRQPHRRDPHHQLPGRRRARPQRPVQHRHPQRRGHRGQRRPDDHPVRLDTDLHRERPGGHRRRRR